MLSIKVCADSENTETGEWPLEECMQKLLEDGCNPNSLDIQGEPIVYHMIKNKKKKSLALMLKHGLNLKVVSLDKVTSPFGEALMKMNIEIIDLIYDGLLEGEDNMINQETRAKYIQ